MARGSRPAGKSLAAATIFGNVGFGGLFSGSGHRRKNGTHKKRNQESEEGAYADH